jgi:Ferritin-like
VPEGRLSPGPRDYATVGELYEVVAQSLQALAAAQGEAALFIGEAQTQVDATLAPLPGVSPVTGLQSALTAIHTIVSQGEGAGGENQHSHFLRFCTIGQELQDALAQDPRFSPAWPAATNPVMNPPLHSQAERVHISHPAIAPWLDIGNALYTTSLRCLLQGFAQTHTSHKATWLNASFALMRALVPVGQGLAARPAQHSAATPHAGLTFTPLRTIAALPSASAARLVAERLGQLRERALALPLALVAGETAASWQAVIDLLAYQETQLLGLAGVAAVVPPPLAQKSPPNSQQDSQSNSHKRTYRTSPGCGPHD